MCLVVVAAALPAMLLGCASGPLSLNDQLKYHAHVVASRYQSQVQIVLAQINLPGLSFEQVEERVAIPLERSAASVARISAVKTVSTDGRFVMEVHFENGAGGAELAEIQQIVNGFLGTSALAVDTPTVAVAQPSLL